MHRSCRSHHIRYDHICREIAHNAMVWYGLRSHPSEHSGKYALWYVITLIALYCWYRDMPFDELVAIYLFLFAIRYRLTWNIAEIGTFARSCANIYPWLECCVMSGSIYYSVTATPNIYVRIPLVVVLVACQCIMLGHIFHTFFGGSALECGAQRELMEHSHVIGIPLFLLILTARYLVLALGTSHDVYVNFAFLITWVFISIVVNSFTLRNNHDAAAILVLFFAMIAVGFMYAVHYSGSVSRMLAWSNSK